jgi:hypothetical protein
MSRSCYSEDYGDEYPGQLDLFRANVQRSIRGKQGQARLRELRDALLSMPVKALYDDLWRSGDQVCALGAWAARFSPSVAVSNDADDHDIATALGDVGWPRLVVLEAVYLNDDREFEYVKAEGPPRWADSTGRCYGYPEDVRMSITPERRYTKVLEWATNQITR